MTDSLHTVYCAAAGCPKRVKFESVTRLCRPHLNEKRAAERESRQRRCSVDGCRTFLHFSAKNDVCHRHLQQRQREVRAEMALRVQAELKVTKSSREVAEKLGIKRYRVHALAREFARPRPKRLLADIVTSAITVAGITMEELTGRSRQPRLVRVRHAICLIGAQAGHSLPAIGRALGGRDHATIHHGRCAAEERVKRDPDFAVLVKVIRGVRRRKMETITAPVPDCPTLVVAEEEDEAGIVDVQTIGAVCQGIVARVEARIAARTRPVRPRNDFFAEDDEDESHRFHAGIAAGSAALFKAIQIARAA